MRPKKLAKYAWPIALSSLGSIVVGLANTLIMGHCSTEAQVRRAHNCILVKPVI